LKEKFEKNIQEVTEKFQNTNLYLKNLEDNVDDEKLRELFADYGSITSCKVMRDSNGVSRGSGFVAFKSADDAARALTEMNGKMVGSKPLYVALAQRKEDRKAKLQAQFSQMRPVAMAPSVALACPCFHLVFLELVNSCFMVSHLQPSSTLRLDLPSSNL